MGFGEGTTDDISYKTVSDGADVTFWGGVPQPETTTGKVSSPTTLQTSLFHTINAKRQIKRKKARKKGPLGLAIPSGSQNQYEW